VAFFFSKTLDSTVLKVVSNCTFKDLKVFFLLIGIGIILLIIGFPLTIYDLALGYKIENFWVAYTISVVSRIIGNIFIYFISNKFFRGIIKDFLETNRIFKTLQKAIDKNPYKMSFIVKLLPLPSLFKAYGFAVMNITFLQYTIPTIITVLLMNFFIISAGKTMASFMDIINKKKATSNWYTYVIFVLAGMSVIFMLIYARSAYRDMEKDTKLEERRERRKKQLQRNYETFPKAP